MPGWVKALSTTGSRLPSRPRASCFGGSTRTGRLGVKV
jgi:hypothetical protein